MFRMQKTLIKVINFIEATGGTVKTCGNFKAHIFTGPGTFVVQVQELLVDQTM